MKMIHNLCLCHNKVLWTQGMLQLGSLRCSFTRQQASELKHPRMEARRTEQTLVLGWDHEVVVCSIAANGSVKAYQLKSS